MKNIALLLSFIWITGYGYAQQHENRISVSDNIYLVRVSENAYVHVTYDDMAGFGRVGSNGLIFINCGEAFLFDSPKVGGFSFRLHEGKDHRLYPQPLARRLYGRSGLSAQPWHTILCQ